MNIGKKILSAFVEIDGNEATTHSSTDTQETNTPIKPKAPAAAFTSQENNEKFKAYFDNLLNESKSAGPDYFAFSKMIEAMAVIPDEKARFIAAFAGLSAQGLSKDKLTETAQALLATLEKDATHFNETIKATITEKITGKQQAIDEKTKKIQQLSLEITNLNNEIGVLKNQIVENEEKINSTLLGYNHQSDDLKTKISQDIEKIKQYLH